MSTLVRTPGLTYQEDALAEATISTFRRGKADMSPAQRDALEEIDKRWPTHELKGTLNLPNPRGKLSEQNGNNLLSELRKVFFMSWLADLFKFIWTNDFSDTQKDVDVVHCPRNVGDASLSYDEGVLRYRIRMDPESPVIEEQSRKKIKAELSELRLGTLLHELVHISLLRHACRGCDVYCEYVGVGHGRRFQLLAKAIEEESFKLLGLRAHIGRLESIMADMKVPTFEANKYAGPSAHDMERYGFLLPLVEKPNEQKRAREPDDDGAAERANKSAVIDPTP